MVRTFDGDEMNLHMPQNVLAETELRHLAAIPYQMVSPSGNAPIIGIYQDSLLGSYRFTRPNITMTPRDAMNLLMMFPRVNTEAFKGKKQITNFEVLTQILTPMTMQYKTKMFEDGEDYKLSNNVLEIRNGQYIRGQLEKSALASTTKGIIHRIFNDSGPMAASNFIDDLQNVITEYMKSSAFSVGISDLIANRKTQDSIIQVITSQKQEVQSLIEKVHLGIFENNTASTNMAEFEQSVNNVLNKATEQSGKIGRKSLSKDNRFLMIVESGSKGSLINISQMISCLGQQNVDGKRIPYGFDSRTLPHFNKFDDSPNARGFIENSYISGLTAPELFFHAMGGRIGLIDTACKTSQTGYIQRRLIKGLEDLKVEYDMTVRNNKGKIIQFAYGDDGFDSTKAENQSVPLVGMSIEDIYVHYDIMGINDQHHDLLTIYSKGTITRLKKQRAETKLKCQEYIDKMLEARDDVVKKVFKYKNENTVKVPVSFQNLIANIQGQLNLNANSVVDITPLEAFELVEEYFGKLNMLKFVQPQSLFEILYYYYLTPRDLLVVKRFHRKALVLLLETVVLKYKQSIVHPGEMVGVIAGQSLGEPTTQLTLNSLVYESEILVRNSKKEIVKVQIGEFTEQQIKASQKIDYMEDKDTTYAELVEHYEVPCANENGETVWKKIEAVTQHPVINEDGTNTMLKVITKGNREIIATKAKSFLQLVDGKIEGVNGKDLKVGDYLPVSKRPLEYCEIKQLNLRELLGKPVNTEIIDLDYDFGYFVGAFCAEGRMTMSSSYKGINYKDEILDICIENTNTGYIEPIQRFCNKYDIFTKHDTHDDSIHIYSPGLCDVLAALCGISMTYRKMFKCRDVFDGEPTHISDKIVFSNQECILGFLTAYTTSSIYYTDKFVMSGYCRVLLDVQIMLKNMDVVSSMCKCNESHKMYELSHDVLVVTYQQAQKLPKQLQAQLWELRDKEAEFLLEEFGVQLNETTFTNEPNNEAFLTVPNIVNGELIMEDRNGKCPDMLFDEIVSIEEVPNTTNYAYDLTVEDTRNFDCYNGLCLRDTFHLSGVASKSNVTRGVPRIEEILRLTKNPKNPSLTVHMKMLDEADKDKAAQYANMLEHTKLVDVIKSFQIYFDPDDKATNIVEDRLLMEQYYEFENWIAGCDESQTDGQETNAKSKWIVRMELDAEALLDKNITMDDIHFAITNSYEDEISCVYTDFNMKNLVFRIRLNGTALSKPKKNKGGASAETLDQSDDIYLLRSFQDTVINNVVLRGVNGIKNVLPRKLQNYVVKEDGKYNRKDVWVLDTTGTNLMEVLAKDFVDGMRTYSNDIKEMFDVLGIEAARQVVYNEFVDVMEFSDVYINYHHLSLLADRMTSTINMVSIFRSGILNDDIGPISKSTFEVHTEVLLNASRHAEFDHMRGVSASVMMGQHGYFGTGAFNLTLDMKAMETQEDVEVDTKDNATEIEKMFGFMEDKTDICSKNNIEIINNITAIKHEDVGCVDDDYDMGF